MIVDEAHALPSALQRAATNELSVEALNRAARRTQAAGQTDEADRVQDAADAFENALLVGTRLKAGDWRSCRRPFSRPWPVSARRAGSRQPPCAGQPRLIQRPVSAPSPLWRTHAAAGSYCLRTSPA